MNAVNKYLAYEQTEPLAKTRQKSTLALMLRSAHRLSCYFISSDFDTWLEERKGYQQVLQQQVWPTWLNRRAKLFKKWRATLIQKNMRLVFREIARKQWLVDNDDLLHEGMLGLIRAIDKFDPRKAQLSTYATLWIKSYVHQANLQQAQAVKRPTDIISDSILLEKELWQRQESGLSEARKQQVEQLNGHSLSMASEAMSSFTEQFLQEHAPRKPILESLLLLKQLERLKPREKMILKLRYGINQRRSYSLEEVSVQLNLSPERVRQLEQQALKQLREGI